MRKGRKLLSLFLVLMMCLNIVSVSAYAEGIEGVTTSGKENSASAEEVKAGTEASNKTEEQGSEVMLLESDPETASEIPPEEEPAQAESVEVPGFDVNTAPGVDEAADPNAAPGTEETADLEAAPGTEETVEPEAVPGSDETINPDIAPGSDPVGTMQNGDPDSEHYFTTQPAGGNIPVDGYIRISWETSFVPEKVVIGYTYTVSSGGYFPTTSEEFHTTATITENLSASMFYDLDYDDASEKSYEVRAYTGSYLYVASNEFSITKTPRQVIQTPAGGNIEVDGTLRLNWRTNYVPERVLIGYYEKVSSGGIFPTITDEFRQVAEVTENLKASMYYDISYDEALESSRYVIRAYFGSSSSYYKESDEFEITKTPYQFLVQPKGGSIAPDDQTLKLSWKTNFTPREVRIGYYYTVSSGGIFPTYSEEFHEVVSLEEGLSANMSYPLPYDDTKTSDKWVVKVCLPNSWYFLESDLFSITKTDRTFTSAPNKTISVSTGSSTPLSWKTNFKSVKAEIVYETSKGGETLIQTLAGAATGASTSWSLPYSQAYPTGYYEIRAYYNSTKYIKYKFQLSIASGVTVSPGEIQINPNSGVNITWPKQSASRIEVWSDRSGELEKEASLRGDLTSYQVYWKAYPESFANYNLYLKVFSSNGTHYFSNTVSVENLDYVFEFEEGEHFDIEPDQTVTVTFRKSFTPTRIEVWSKDLQGTVSVLSTTLPGDTASFDIPYDYGDWVFFEAYYGTGDDHVTAVAILHKTERAFVVQPVEDPADSATVYWETNFMPKKIELARVGLDDNWNATYTVVKTMAGNENSVFIPDNENYYVVRAYYEDYKGEDFVKSNSLMVTGDAGYGFTVHPQSGISKGGAPYRAGWAVNFDLALVEVKAVDAYGNPLDDGDSLFTADTTGSGQNRTTSIQLAAGVKECDFRIYAYYWENGYPFISDIFTVTAGNACGQTLIWSLDNGRLTISGTGAMYDFDALEDPAPWYSQREEITSLVIEDGVTTIGNYAFCNCTNLKGNSIASSVETIGKGGFYGCTSISTLTIPSGVKTIGERAFFGTSSLGSITLPDSVTSLGEWAFYMSGLQIIRFGSGLKSVPKGAFASTKLVNVTIPDCITAIGDNAFNNITTLSRVTFSQRLKNIGEGAFGSCTKLNNVTFPDSLTSIGNAAFSGCIVLARIVFPANVTSIGSSAFADCSALTSIHFKGNAPAIGYKAFANVTATAYYLVGLGNWTSDVMQNYGGSITWRGLQKCGDSLTWDLDSQGVLTISGEGAMWDFGSTEPGWVSSRADIKTVDIGYKVTSIGASAFYQCYNLDTVLVGQAVTSVGNYAFRGCSSLNAVVFNGEAPTIEFRAFYGITTTAYYIPGSTWTSSVMQDYGGTVTWIGADGMCGDHAFWTIDKDHVLHITGSGPMYDWTGFYNMLGSENVPWGNFIEEITAVEIEDGITTIGSWAFCTCSALKTASIPDSVTSIGLKAFYDCSVLESAGLPANLLSIGEKAFYRCKMLSDVELPEKLQTIGVDAFYHCDMISELVIPDTVTSMGSDAFSWCQNLESVIIGNGISLVPYNAFNRCVSLTSVVLPQSVTSLGSYAFSSCTSLNNIVLPDNLHVINQGAFSYSGLKQITIPTSVTEIGLMAFTGCENLKDAYYYDSEENWNANVTLGSMNTDLTNVLHFVRAKGECGADGDNLTWLLEYDGSLLIRGEGAMKDYASNTSSSTAWFAYKADITSVTIEEGATSVGNYAFRNCVNLKNAELPESITSIGSNAFNGCKLLETADIPSGVTFIGSTAFSGCAALKRVNIPYGITDIPQDAFRSCSSLEELTIPDTVTKINNYAFNGCSSLEEVTIPASVKNIGSAAFQGCSSLEHVTLSDGLEILGYMMFTGCTSLKNITIPAEVTDIPYRAFGGCTALTEVFFKGSATTFGDTPFYNVITTVYYPMDDPSWTEGVRQDYGGTLTWIGGICIDEINFPDENFRDLVLDNFDLDANGWLNQSEINKVTGFSVEDVDFQTVKGIEYFTELTSLLLDGAPSLKSIDFSANTKLTYVDVCCNGLTSINLEGLTELRKLYVDQNNLSWLDVSELQLEELYCEFNPLGSLELGTQPNLKKLFCYGTEGSLKLLDLRNCPILLNIYQNGTKTVPDWGDRYDLSGVGTLYLDAGTEILTPDCIPVNSNYFPDAQFRSYIAKYLDTNHTGWLTPEERAEVIDLVLINDQIENLDGIEYFTELISLEYCDGPLEAMDASMFTKLNYLDLSGQTRLTSLNIDGLTSLEYLHVSDTGLKTLDVSGSSGLVYLTCYDMPLSTLTLGSQEHLTLLECYGTNLTELNLYGCPILLDAYEKGTRSVKDDYVEYKGPQGGVLRVDPETEIVTREPEGIYMLWLGSTQVTDQNKNDILGDGSASYDPASGTLSFTKAPAITGAHNGALIYVNGIDLAISAPAGLSLNGTDVDVIYAANNGSLVIFGNITVRSSGSYGLRAKNITIYGDVDIEAKESALYTYNGDIVVNGNVKAIATATGTDTFAHAIFATRSITIDGNVTASANHIAMYARSGGIQMLSGVWTLEGGTYAILSGSNKEIKIPAAYEIKTPEGGQFTQVSGAEELLWTVTEADGVTVAKKVVIEQKKLDIKFNRSCSFGNNLSVNYYVPAASVEGYENIRLVVRKQVFNATGSEYTWEEYTVTNPTNYTNGGVAYKRFIFSNVAAKEMGDELHVVLYADKDGITFESSEDVYSVKQYAYNRLEKSTNAVFKTLLVDLLNYGAAAQVYFNYNTSHLANAELTEAQQALGTAEVPELEGVPKDEETSGATAQIPRKNIVMSSNVEMKFAMTFESGEPAASVKLVLSYTAIDGTNHNTTIPSSEFGYDSSIESYTAKLTTIAAKDMSSIVTAKIYDGDQLISNVYYYSIETYVRNRLSSSTNEVFKELIRELIKYGKSAEAYFRQSSN